MRACFAIPNAWIGGIRTFALNLGAQFRREGCDVSCVIPARGESAVAVGDIESFRAVMEVRTVLQRRVLLRSQFIRRVAEMINELAPDVLLLNHTIWGQAALPYLDPRICRILVVHNITPEELALPRANSGWWDGLVAVGPGVHAALARQWDARRLRLIPVGVAEPAEPVRTTFDNPKLQICYVGRIEQAQKNVLLIPQIARILRDRGVRFTWTVAGDGPDHFRVRALVKEFNLEDCFHFTGVLPACEVGRLLARQNVLVLPSFFESIGHVLQEAQMHGVVPVASRLADSIGYVVTDQYDGLLCRSDDAGDFADKIALLHADRALMRRMSMHGAASVRQRFAIPLVARQYRRFIEDVPRGERASRKKAVFGLCAAPPQLFPPRWLTACRMLHRATVNGVGVQR